MSISTKLWQYILIGMVAGMGLGFLLSPETFGLLPRDTAYAIGTWVSIPGVVFLALISMVIIPLVVTSIILGVSGSGDAGFVKRIALRVVPYFLITAVIAVLIGIAVTEIVRPGDLLAQKTEISAQAPQNLTVSSEIKDLTIADRIRNLIPTNPVKSALNLDFLQIVIGAILIGLVVLTVPRASVQSFMDLCVAVQVISSKVIEWAMVIAPYAVFGLITEVAIRIGPRAFVGLGGYMFCVLLGLALVVVMYALIVKFIAGRSIIEFAKASRAVQLLAFSTSSSAAVMPVTLQTVEEKMGVHSDTARFVVPLGTTVNMDGTGLYQAVAAVFLCQFFGIELGFWELMALALTMVGASIGTPATPGVGIVVLATIVAGLGVPPAGIALILGVDRILDMCRTVVNVTGDLVASVVMQRWLHGRASLAMPAN